jgi:hypothetical protein
MIEVEDAGKRKSNKGKDVVTKGKRRNSVSEVDGCGSRSVRRNSVSGRPQDRGIGRRSIVEESPVIPVARKRSRIRYIEDSDLEDGIDGLDNEEEDPAQTDLNETQQTEIIMDEEEHQRDTIIIIDSSPTKRLPNVIVEIPLKPHRKSRRRTTLEEIPLENTIINTTPETSPQKLIIHYPPPPPGPERSPSPQQPPFMDDEPHLSQEVENIVLSAVPTTPQITKTEVKLPTAVVGQTTAMSSPTKSNGIARILAKSPNRPMYRVGLSRRVNVEPLHGYLKRNAS